MRTICLAMFGLLIGGCAMDGGPVASGPHDQCLVCKMNADLACVDVAVTSRTPTYMFNGQTYYFCSDECREKFAKEPAKYVGK